MIYLLLVYEFFKTGLFSFGGGYATIPFLYHISETYGWYSVKELTQMIAVASVTPGPVGINVATLAGIKTTGIVGAMLATIAEVLPSFFFVILVSKILNKFRENFYVKALLDSLKPVCCALLASVSIGLLKPQLFDIKAMMLLAVLLIISWKSKKSPLFYMLIAGVIGVSLSVFGL